MAKNIDFMGAVFPDVPSVKLPQQGGGLVAFDDTTDATATADKILEGYTAYAGGEKLVGTASGGITPSGTYSITSNGIYDIVSFASVDVNVSGGGGGITADDVAMRAISGVVSGNAIEVRAYAFTLNQEITEANFPSATAIGSAAFSGCYSLNAVNFPRADSMYPQAFYSCRKLSTASFQCVSYIGSSAFRGCSLLTSLYLLSKSVVSIASTNVFQSTPMSVSTYTGSFGSIYVPASLVDSYKSAARWSAYADRITSYVE